MTADGQGAADRIRGVRVRRQTLRERRVRGQDERDPDRQDKQTGEWVDMETMFFDVTPYGKAQEQAVAGSRAPTAGGERAGARLRKPDGEEGSEGRHVQERVRPAPPRHRPQAQEWRSIGAVRAGIRGVRPDASGPGAIAGRAQSPSSAQSGFDDPWAGGASFSSFGATDSFSAGPDEPEF